MTLKIFHAEYEGVFVYAPSFLLAEQIEADGGLFEGKAIGTAKTADLVLARDILNSKGTPEQFAKARKVGTSVGAKKLEDTRKTVTMDMGDLIWEWKEKKIGEAELRKRAVKVMKTAWRNAFLAGLRAGGVKGEGAGRGKTLVQLSPGDDNWLKGAVRQEMGFLNKFLTAIVEETYKMPLPRRLQMYVDTLDSFYESARVIAMPNDVLIRWTGPRDKKTCPGCRYMFEHNPYSKYTIPCVPASGETPCLSNCRDILNIRRVGIMEAQALTKGQNRDAMVRKLMKIKRGG